MSHCLGNTVSSFDFSTCTTRQIIIREKHSQPQLVKDLGIDTHAFTTELEVPYSRYGLNNKVTTCVTDNGSKFVKALK